MTRTIGSAMTVVAAIMVAGCTMDVASSDVAPGARANVAESERQQASEPLVSPQAAANVLVFGDQVNPINALANRLRALGHTVTVPSDFKLPTTIQALAGFHTIWHIGRITALTATERLLLKEYLKIGGGLHLTGEGSGSSNMNASLSMFVQAVVENGSGIVIGNPITVPGPNNFPFYPVNENALGNVANTPNMVRHLEMTGVGGITGIAITSPNALVIGGLNRDKVVGAIWGSNDLVDNAGKLSLLMDSDWLSRLAGTNDNLKLIQNLQEHMTGSPFINQPPTALAAVAPGQILDCNAGDNVAREFVPVRLDGTGSIDPDNAPQPLTYTWFRNGENIATGPTPTINLEVGTHTIALRVFDGEAESFSTIDVLITCTIECTPGSGLFNRCHPGCPCDHAEGDCDTDNDCLPGLICLHDAGFAFGYEDDEVDVCSNVPPTLGVGAWNYCAPAYPCDIGQGDCETDADCLPGLHCESDVGPSFGFQREVDVCEPN